MKNHMIEWTPLTSEEIARRAAVHTGFKLSTDAVKSLIKSTVFLQIEETTMTVCVLVLNSGSAIIGQFSCIDPANFDIEIGRTFAYQDALDQLMQREGYMAATMMALAEQNKDLG